MNLDIARIQSHQNLTRNELNNIRKNIQALKALHKKDISRIEQLLNKKSSQESVNETALQKSLVTSQNESVVTWKPIGHISSWFHSKNGTPRQGSVTSLSRGILKLSKDIFTNPQHSLEGIQEFSYVWLIFIFDRNGPAENTACSNFVKAKVAPPRLNGQKVGVFASRSPHRPNPLGLTLAKLESLEGDCLHLSGLDILDGTPIVDIKPYIPEYDQPAQPNNCGNFEKSNKSLYEIKEANIAVASLELRENSQLHIQKKSTKVILANNDNSERAIDDADSSHNTGNQIQCKSKCKEEDKTGESVKCELPIEKQFSNNTERKDLIGSENDEHTKKLLQSEHEIDIKVAPWLIEPPVNQLEVIINPRAEKQIILFSSDSPDLKYRLKYLRNSEELYEAICSVLREDPRSIYRRQKCSSQLYFFTVDTAHCTVWFDENIAEVLKVKPTLEQE